MTDYFDLQLNRDELLKISALGFAHLGDAVYEVMVRAWVNLHGAARSKDLHKQTVQYVTAPAQAAMAQTILPMLDEEEADVFRRGRNAAPHSIAKAATRSQYQTATALESLFGWLWLQGRRDRLNQLFEAMMEGEGNHAP